jgi:PASTA domain
MGTFVRRLLALTVVWLLATAALTFAAAQHIGSPPATVSPVTPSPAPSTRILVVPDVRRQAYVFAKGTLGDAGFAWRVSGRVAGYASNTVVSQAPAPGVRVIDTGAPLVVVRLARSGPQLGLPEQSSAVRGTAIRLADLASAVSRPALPVRTKAAVKKKVAVKRRDAVKVAATPHRKSPQRRPPAFVVPGARREPLDEIPLPQRATNLLRWAEARPTRSDVNVRYWLYQHAWIVTGAEMGWWRGAEALKTLVGVDQQLFRIWGIGDLSKAVAERALATVEGRSA